MSPRKKQLAPSIPELTQLELTIMQVLWNHKSATAAEVATALQKKRPLAITTIHTVLGNLKKKGFVQLVPTVERSLRFAPAVQRERVARKALTKLLKEFFNNSPRLLMIHLLQNENVDDKTLGEIRQVLRANRKKEGERK